MTTATTPRTILGPKARVRWTAAKPGTWAGDGLGVVTNFVPARPYFGAAPGTGKDTPGPAYEIQLDGKGEHRVWVGFDDVVAL